MGDEQLLRPPHTRIRLEGNAAEDAEHARPTTTAERVPEEIGGKTARHGDGHRQPQAQSPRTCEGADDQQERHRGQGNARLIEEDPAEDHGMSVPHHEVDDVVHAVKVSRNDSPGSSTATNVFEESAWLTTRTTRPGAA